MRAENRKQMQLTQYKEITGQNANKYAIIQTGVYPHVSIPLGCIPVNGLRDVHYQFFSLSSPGANPWARVHQNRRWPAIHPGLPSGQISSPCVNPCWRYPLQTICTQTNKQRNE